MIQIHTVRLLEWRAAIPPRTQRCQGRVRRRDQGRQEEGDAEGDLQLQRRPGPLGLGKAERSGKKDRRLPKEGSSKAASAWWQSHRNAFVCDTQPHTARFSIDKVEKGSKGRLKDGTAWVQFCVTNGDDIVLSGSDWVKVQA